MSKIVIGKSLPTLNSGTPAKEILYKFALMTYGHWRDFKHLLNGTAKLIEDEKGINWSYDESVEVPATHKQFGKTQNFEYEDGQKFNGWIICTEKNIPILTKHIQDFYNDPLAIKAKLQSPITLLRICEPYSKDVKVPVTATNIINELIPEPAELEPTV